MKIIPGSIAAMALLIACAGVQADVVVLKDGTRLEGRVEPQSEHPERVSFVSATGQLELPRARVAQIIDESDAQDWTHIGNQYLKQKDYTSSVKMFQRALESEASFQPARDGLDEAQKAIEAMQEEHARTAQQQMDDQLTQVSDFLASNTYDDDRFQEIEKQLNTIMTSTESTDEQKQSATRLMRDLYLAWGFARFDRLDYAGAESKYVRVLEMDPGNKDATDKLLKIWRNDASKKPEVLKVRLQELKEDPNNLDLNKEVADLLYELKRYEESIEPLKKIAAAPRFQGQGYETKLKNAFEATIEKYQTEGKPEKAIALLKEEFSLNLTQNQTRLDRMQYEYDVSQLPEGGPDYWTMRAELARDRLNGPGLEQYKERELELVLRSDTENQTALGELRRIAEGKLQKAQESLRGGEYYVARDEAKRFMDTEKRFPDLVTKAQEVYNAADLEAKRQAQQARETAKQIAENANRYYEAAQRDLNSMIQQERLNNDSETKSYSYMNFKGSAIKNADRSIQLYKLALQYDPSLGDATSMDLNARMADAQRLYDSLTESPRPLPRARNRN